MEAYNAVIFKADPNLKKKIVKQKKNTTTTTDDCNVSL